MERDCFAYKNNKCIALKRTYCRYKNSKCNFYKKRKVIKKYIKT